MELNVIEEVHVQKANYTVNTTLNRGNHTLNKPQENAIVDKPTAKRCLFLWIGVLIGSVVSAVTVFLVVQYGVHLSYNGSSCLWTQWTSWTGCKSLLISGTEKRERIYTGPSTNCELKDRFETRTCHENESACFWTEWTEWTGCNSLLTSGTEKRVQIYTGYTNCQQKERLETKTCNDNVSSCLWTEWTSWTGCKSLLISGTEKREQIYTGLATNCEHKERFETRSCHENESACFWTEWTEWTGCNSLLTSGTEKRVKIYTGYAHCQQKEIFETRTCNDNVSSCLWTEWTSWTGCKSLLISGTEKREQIYTGLATNCEHKERFESRICHENESACFWTEWTKWTGCNSLLTSGTEKRVKIYTGYAHCQQKEIFETRTCNDNVTSCFWTEWTSWTPCETSLIIGKQTRAQKHTGYFKKCEEKERYETKFCYDATKIFFDRKLDIRFDHTTLYSKCYLSIDNTTLSNRYTDRTPYNPRAESGFKNYKGAMVNTCVEISTSIYYEIYFQYVITSNLSSTWLVLELGIGERNKIDNSYTVADMNVSGWSFLFNNCLPYNKVCLTAWHNSRITFTKQFSNNTAGTSVNGRLGILIDRERNKFSLFYNDTVLFTFNDVLSNVPLCPVFGAYNHEYVQVNLQIVSVGNMTSMV